MRIKNNRDSLYGIVILKQQIVVAVSLWQNYTLKSLIKKIINLKRSYLQFKKMYYAFDSKFVLKQPLSYKKVLTFLTKLRYRVIILTYYI